MAETSITEKEMAEAIDIFLNFDPTPAYDIAERIRGKPIYIVGMGSSLLMPGGFAKYLAADLIPEQRIEVVFPSCLDAHRIPKDAYVFLNSNSGNTPEVIDLGELLRINDIPFFGITAQEGSHLAEISNENSPYPSTNKNSYILRGGFEQATPATKSVVEQTLFFHALICKLSYREFTLGKNGRETAIVAEKMIHNLSMDIDEEDIVLRLMQAETIYWIDHNTGVAEELALKTQEITGIRGVYYPGTQILHGPAEGFGINNRIIVVGAKNYLLSDINELYEQAGEANAGAYALESSADMGINIEAVTTPGSEVYAQLTAGWNLLRKMVNKNPYRDIDKPNIIGKSRT
ncbi:hypothetical protein HOC35_07250 [Candidatus Woesearchaeota archaeon]|nr:hypothetical protein [Candidatus Woesearchaeota archaeon]